MADPIDLGDFEGRTITKTTIAVKKAGDGLSQAQKVEPTVLRQGETVYVVLECEVGTIHFKPVGDLEEERCADLNTIAATIIDDEAVKRAVASMKERLAVIRAAEKSNGGTLPEPSFLAGEHRAGLHDNDSPSDHPECPECNPNDEQ